MNKKALKIILFIVLAGGIIFGGLISVIISLFSGALFYSNISIILTLFLIFFLFISIFRIFQPRKRWIILGTFSALLLVSVGAFEISQYRVENIPTVSDRGIDLNNYRPFENTSQIASLGEPSTFKIENNLPKLDGATALYPLYSAFVQAVYPPGEYPPEQDPVRCGGTIDAYQNIIEGRVDMIFAAKPSALQTRQAQEKGLQFNLTPIGREAFVFFVNSKNPINALTSSQIKDIYSGKITNWSQVGGNNEDIKAFQRPEGSGSQTMLQKVMQGEQLMDPPTEDIPAGMGDIIKQTADYKNYKNAIGYTFLIYATELVRNDQIKLLAIDGIAPNKDSIKNKTYPFTADFYTVTTNSQNPHLQEFTNWILSPQGRELIEKTGYTPI